MELPADSGNSRPNPFPPGGLKRYFLYQAAFTNNGEKKIKGILCDYVFFDPISKQELGRHRMMNYASIGRGKSKVLYGKDYAPPSHIVSVEALETNRRSPYTEQIEIKCVQYADGSMWSSPSMREGECGFLRLTVKRKFSTKKF